MYQLLLVAALAPSAPPTEVPVVQTILSTDFSTDRDVDDWFDVAIFVTQPELNPVGIVMEHYATDRAEDKLRELLATVGMIDIPIARGIQRELRRVDGKLWASRYHDGAKLILAAMRRAPGKVRLIAVGSLRNEALAYETDPALFRQKLELLYFVGGNLEGKPECNLMRDLLAAEIIFNAPVPKVWVPGQWAVAQKFDGVHEAALRATDKPVARKLAEGLDVWRERRGQHFLRVTHQLPGEGKNLWSMPAFLHAAARGGPWTRWRRGRAYYAAGKHTQFDADADSGDLMLVENDAKAICDWVMKRIGEL